MIYDKSNVWDDPANKPKSHKTKRRARGKAGYNLKRYAKRFTREKFALKYIKMIFDSTLADNGGPMRRKLAHVKKYVGLNRLLGELPSRGFRAVKIGDYIVLFSDEFRSRNLYYNKKSDLKIPENRLKDYSNIKSPGGELGK
jgi:hypothetical protein